MLFNEYKKNTNKTGIQKLKGGGNKIELRGKIILVTTKLISQGQFQLITYALNIKEIKKELGNIKTDFAGP